jgi:hypothetical protein
MNEHTIQNHLFRYLESKKQTLIVPNVKLYSDLESDLVSVSKAGLVSEYEIKISVADFKRDFTSKRRKHVKLAGGHTFRRYTPNYFNFVFPYDLYASHEMELPFYAGLLLVKSDGQVIQTIQAKRIHRLKASERDINYLSRGLMYRYWRGRLQKQKRKWAA